MNLEFLTYFDVHYAACGMTMIDSLLSSNAAARVTVLCLDDKVASILTAETGKRVRAVGLEALADHEPRLRPLQALREPWEFYATHKPVLMDWALHQQEEDTLVAFIDADTCFFSDPASLFEEAQQASIALSPHRFNDTTQHLSLYGTYNAGFGLWRNDATGRECLKDWTNECLAWCYARVEEDGRFMNQGYLNRWPSRYEKVHVLSHPGANLAPWNVGTHVLEKTPQGVTVDALPLIFYHFSCLSRNADGLWQTYDQGEAMRQSILHQEVYAPYLKALESMSQRLLTRHGITGLGSVRTRSDIIPMISFEGSG